MSKISAVSADEGPPGFCSLWGRAAWRRRSGLLLAVNKRVGAAEVGHDKRRVRELVLLQLAVCPIGYPLREDLREVCDVKFEFEGEEGKGVEIRS